MIQRGRVFTLAWMSIAFIVLQPALASSSHDPVTTSTDDPAGVYSRDRSFTWPGSRIAQLRHSLEENPGQPDVLVALGTELEAIGDLRRALDAYRLALSLEPANALAYYHFSNASRRLHAITETRLMDQERALARERNAQVHVGRGEALAAMGQDVDAVHELSHALTLSPEHPQARLSLGLALFNIGEIDRAIHQYRAVLHRHPELPEARLRLAKALIAKREWKAAEGELRQATRLRPDWVEAHLALASMRYTLGDVEGTIESYRDVLQLRPEFAEARYNLALVYKLDGREDEAIQELVAAARAGVPDAQYFVGMAYLHGRGVPPDRSVALEWLFRADEQGVGQAREILAQLRRQALVEPPSNLDQPGTLTRAFADIRDGIWRGFPELDREGPGDTVGANLLRAGRAGEAVPILIREAGALIVRSQVLLAALYEEGVEGEIARFDERILRYFEGAAVEGAPQAQVALARIYGLGLGVPPDEERAIRLLRDHREPSARRLVSEIAGRAAGDRHALYEGRGTR